MKDFAELDFETANRSGHSVCAVGVVIVCGGEITDKFYSLIRPAPNWYARLNIETHGLTRADTDSAEKFPAVWAKIVPRIAGLPLVAHNIVFDENCLKDAHNHYGMPYPNYQFYCTCQASRRTFKELPDHRLPTVAAHCGYKTFTHHNALEDAEACAAIALRVFRD